MKWTNHQFGELDYDSRHEITFPQGLIGFERTTRFLLVNDESATPFLWLVSLEDPDLCFPLIDPQLVLPGYAVAGVAPDATVLNLVALRTPLEDSTVNLRSPVVIGKDPQVGRQLVLESDQLSFRQPLFSAAAAVKG